VLARTRTTDRRRRALDTGVAVLGPLVVTSGADATQPTVGADMSVWELTSVADDEAVAYSTIPDGEPQDDVQVRRWSDLEPDSDYERDGVSFRTLPRPRGERLATICTVNDVHFGEIECGVLEGFDLGPVFRSEPDEDPYPEIMNRGAIAEIAALDPDAVIAKGDLANAGLDDEFQAFLDHYGAAFGDRLHYVRGNHDTLAGGDIASDAPAEITLPGVIVALLDTTIPGHHTGQVTAPQLDWLDDLGGRADRPVLVMGHHHPWSPDSRQRHDGYFGINPDDSETLVDVVARRPALVGYFAGHTHRNRARRFSATGDVPWVEVACVKDFPGAWAEYRVFEGGVLQVFHRISEAAALRWSEKTRGMFGGTYPQYAFGQLSDRCFPIWPR